MIKYISNRSNKTYSRAKYEKNSKKNKGACPPYLLDILPISFLIRIMNILFMLFPVQLKLLFQDLISQTLFLEHSIDRFLSVLNVYLFDEPFTIHHIIIP